jgi:SIR2-like domain
LDNLLERALNHAGWYQPDNFIVVVNGKDRSKVIVEHLNSCHAPLKIIKLHGSLESPQSYAFRREEIFDFEKKIKSDLSRLINQSLIMVGYSGQDRDVDLLFEEEGREIHFVKPTIPDDENRIFQTLSVRGKGKIIDGKDGNFDTFFEKLLSFIEDDDGETSNYGSHIDVFLKSIDFGKELENPRSRYKNLTDLYVKPTEYDEICSKLEKNHIIFIIGEPHLGKTYTAIYLLWQYYQRGYETVNIRHDHLVTMLHEKEKSFERFLLSLMSSKEGSSVIIHLDDPFGETMERRTSEFAKGLNDFLSLSNEYEHLRIIVTSRLDIFGETIAEQHYQNIEELEKHLRVHTSYKSNVLIDILHKYTQFYKPIWSTDEKITQEIDRKLPEMLPAPHNIEFFVRTSERLTLLEEVLQHIDKSKEMIRALGGWMSSLSAHEQIFLMWIEIQSTSNILFANDSASKVNLEVAYRYTLAFLYKTEQIPSIPPRSFFAAKDKFSMILLESKDKESKVGKFDFIHPSYHEAFWYAINGKSNLLNWWEAIKEKPAEILGDLDNKLSRSQMRMIENYGIVNRDLDKLLFISAESEDVDERAIALEHMMERIDIFIRSPSFSSCVEAAISSKDPRHRMVLINLLYKYFDVLPLNIIDKSMLLLTDSEIEIQKKYLKIYSVNRNEINKFRNSPEFKIGLIVEKLQLTELLNKYLYNQKMDPQIISKYFQITIIEFKILFKSNLKLGYDLTRFVYENKDRLRDISSKPVKNMKNIQNYLIKNLGKKYRRNDYITLTLKADVLSWNFEFEDKQNREFLDAISEI